MVAAEAGGEAGLADLGRVVGRRAVVGAELESAGPRAGLALLGRRRVLRHGEVGADAVHGLEHRRLRVAHAGGDGVHDHDERDRERHADRDDRGLPAAPGELAPEVGEEHGFPRRSGETHRAGRRTRR